MPHGILMSMKGECCIVRIGPDSVLLCTQTDPCIARIVFSVEGKWLQKQRQRPPNWVANFPLT